MLLIIALLSLIALNLYKKIAVNNFPSLLKTDAYSKNIASGAGVMLWDILFLSSIYLFMKGVVDQTISISILTASFCFTVFGWLDDLIELKPKQKLIGQIVISVLSIGFFYYNCKICIDIKMLFLVFLLVWLVNAINFIDILDGLASGVVLIILSSFIICGYLSNNMQVYYISIFLLIPLLVFFIKNVYKPQIYLGDAGAHFLGCCLFFLSYELYSNHAKENIMGLFLFLNFFFLIFDFLFVCIYRKLQNKSLFLKSNDHLTFLILKFTKSEKKTLLVLLSCQFSVSLIAVISFYSI